LNNSLFAFITIIKVLDVAKLILFHTPIITIKKIGGSQGPEESFFKLTVFSESTEEKLTIWMSETGSL